MGLRVLLVSDNYPPYLGGAHRQTYLLSQELHKRGHDVCVATVWQPGTATRENDNGVDVVRLKQLRTALSWRINDKAQRYQPPFPDPITVTPLRRLITQFNPDVVHSHGWISFSCAFALLGKKTPLLISARDYGYSCTTRQMIYMDRELCSGPAPMKCLRCATNHFGFAKGTTAFLSVYSGRRLLLHKLSGIHAVSAFVLKVMIRDFVGTHTSRLESQDGQLLERVISSFMIDPEPDAPEFADQLPHEPFILYVGGLQQSKGLATLLAAYERLTSPPPLVIIGYVAPDMPKTYPSGVFVFKNVPHRNVMTAWRRCMFGVVPSFWPDPSPGVVREAMSCGKAVIGTNVGGTPEMITNGLTGILFQPEDSDALQAAMQQLIDDPMLREQLGTNARQAAEQYRAEVSVAQFEQLYQQLLDNAPATKTENPIMIDEYSSLASTAIDKCADS